MLLFATFQLLASSPPVPLMSNKLLQLASNCEFVMLHLDLYFIFGPTLTPVHPVDSYIKIATTANDVTTSTGYLLLAYNTVAFEVPNNYKVGVISAGTGTLTIHKAS